MSWHWREHEKNVKAHKQHAKIKLENEKGRRTRRNCKNCENKAKK